MINTTPRLCLYNANVITMNPIFPKASWVVLDKGIILAVGRGDPPSKSVIRINCEGRTVLPGFNDAHCHVLSSSAQMLSLDCSSSKVRSIEDIKNELKKYSQRVKPQGWIRAVGYDEFYLKEGRHPERSDIDAVVSDNPVKLTHRSGHAVVLNSMGLDLLGITKETPDPGGSVIERDTKSGEPTGLLFDMGEYLDRVIPNISLFEMAKGVQFFSDMCLSYGITSLQDATIHNNIERMKLFNIFKKEGLLIPSLIFMIGESHIKEFVENGYKFMEVVDEVCLGAVKIMLTLTTGVLYPSPGDLRETINYAARNGFQVAVHAIDHQAVSEAARALVTAGNFAGTSLRHRIEHGSECTPDIMSIMASNDVSVVTQPGFLYYSGERYLSEVDRHYQKWLYPINSLMSLGVKLAYGSDNPVIPINPLVGVHSAVNRISSSGDKLTLEERVSPLDALRMYTLGGAYVSYQENIKGSIEKGKVADVILLDQDPTVVREEDIINIKVLMTIVSGSVAWSDPTFFRV